MKQQLDIGICHKFVPYHNKLVSFKYENEWRRGVILDEIPYSKKEFSCQYIFIDERYLSQYGIMPDEVTTSKIDIRKISEIEYG